MKINIYIIKNSIIIAKIYIYIFKNLGLYFMKILQTVIIEYKIETKMN